MERQAKGKRSKAQKREDFFEWLLFFSDILLFIPRIFIRLIRWFVDLF